MGPLHNRRLRVSALIGQNHTYLEGSEIYFGVRRAKKTLTAVWESRKRIEKNRSSSPARSRWRMQRIIVSHFRKLLPAGGVLKRASGVPIRIKLFD
jgi:hypothetical protein